MESAVASRLFAALDAKQQRSVLRLEAQRTTIARFAEADDLKTIARRSRNRERRGYSRYRRNGCRTDKRCARNPRYRSTAGRKTLVGAPVGSNVKYSACLFTLRFPFYISAMWKMPFAGCGLYRSAASPTILPAAGSTCSEFWALNCPRAWTPTTPQRLSRL